MFKRSLLALSSALAFGIGSIGVPHAGAFVNDPNIMRPLTSSTHRWVTPAQPGGYDTIVFGDSQAVGLTFPIWVDDRGCQRSDSEWPEQLRKMRGLSPAQLHNAACPGAGLNSGAGLHLSDQVRRAESFGGLGPNTKNIYIQLGINDIWGNNASSAHTNINCLISPFNQCTDHDIAANRVQDHRAVTPDEYTRRIKPVIDYLKYYAPNAKIHIVSYMSGTDGNNPHVCTNMFGVNAVRHAPALVALVNAMHHAQRETAKNLGLNFIDLRAATRGHESCSPDPWAHGIADPRLRALGVWWHPTPHGDHQAAREISRTAK